MMNQNIKVRQSNFELLRIFAMILIIAHHFSVHGGFDYSIENISFNRVLVQFLGTGGKIGVNVFVLISGYFLIDGSKNNFKKIVKLESQLLFYSVVIYLLMVFTNKEPFVVSTFIKSFLPVLAGDWWFASTYFVLLLLSPYINIFIKHLTQEEYKKFLFIVIFLWSVIPTFTTYAFQGSNLTWFLVLYCISAYIKIYGVPEIKKDRLLIIYILSITFIIISVVVIDIMGYGDINIASNARYFSRMEKLPTFIASLAIFEFFRNLKIKQSKIINLIASTTFGVYLIHDHYLMRKFIWIDMFQNNYYKDNPKLLVFAALAIIIVFFICGLIELIRINTLEKYLIKFMNYISPKENNKNIKTKLYK